MAFVLERGINVNVLDDCGRTPLHVAVGLCHYNTSLHFLISQGADASIKDHQGKTPLDCAAGFGLPVDEFTKSLLNRNTSLVSELAVSNR
jgi:ankyrin repeat protein